MHAQYFKGEIPILKLIAFNTMPVLLAIYCHTSFEEFNVVHPFFCVFEQAEKNAYLEERLQVLQQQNEDLNERIDKNVAVSRSDNFKTYF